MIGTVQNFDPGFANLLITAGLGSYRYVKVLSNFRGTIPPNLTLGWSTHDLSKSTKGKFSCIKSVQVHNAEILLRLYSPVYTCKRKLTLLIKSFSGVEKVTNIPINTSREKRMSLNDEITEEYTWRFFFCIIPIKLTENWRTTLVIFTNSRIG